MAQHNEQQSKIISYIDRYHADLGKISKRLEAYDSMVYSYGSDCELIRALYHAIQTHGGAQGELARILDESGLECMRDWRVYINGELDGCTPLEVMKALVNSHLHAKSVETLRPGQFQARVVSLFERAISLLSGEFPEDALHEVLRIPSLGRRLEELNIDPPRFAELCLRVYALVLPKLENIETYWKDELSWVCTEQMV